MSSHPFRLCLLIMLAAAPAVGARPPAAPRVDPQAPGYRWPAVDRDGDGVFDRIDRCNDTPRGCTVDEHGCSSDGDRDGVCDGKDRCPGTAAGTRVDEHGCPAGRQGAARPRPAPLEPPREIEPPAPPAEAASESERQLVERGRIRLENIYFETNSAELLPESESSLREAGEALEKFPGLRIEVEGHTDTRGARPYNRRLSQERAATVRRWLLDHFRLNPEHLVSKGYGEERPETQERNDEELLRNRRVVLTVLNPEALPRGVKVEPWE